MSGTDRRVSRSTKSGRGRTPQAPVVRTKKQVDAWKRPSPRGHTADKLIGQLVPELNPDTNDKPASSE